MRALRLAVLISGARHPLTQRPQRSDRDARALELALRQDHQEMTVIHAGSASEPFLPLYLGMGVPFIEVVPCPDTHDPFDALLFRLAALQPDIILCGALGSKPSSQGLLPYRLAHHLNLPIAEQIAEIAASDNGIDLIQAEQGGRRRRLRTSRSLIVTVGSAGPPPRLSAFAKRRDGHVVTLTQPVETRAFKQSIDFRPGKRPSSAARLQWTARPEDRLAAVTGAGSRRDTTVKATTPDEAAAFLLDWLAERGLRS